MRILKILTAGLICCNLSLIAQTDISNVSNNDSLSNTRDMPIFTTSLDISEDEVEAQDVSGLLQSSRDVFTNIAGFNFSAARYRIRGYDSENFTISMNGLTLNNPEGGRAIWAFWGGLNDITRYQETGQGITASPYTFSGIGGFSNINARATDVRPGTRLSYALANRSYQHRVMLTHSTGMMDNGFAVAVSASTRLANEGYVEGTDFSGASYFLSIEKRINNKHSIGLVGFGAPVVQGRSNIAIQEAYDLTGNNYYNSNWGYQNGEKRNSRIRNNHRPTVMLNHYFTVNEKTKITSSLFHSFGKEGNTRLNWYNAADPRPDYYRNLPSYYNVPGEEAMFDQLTSLWQQNDPSTTQLNWDQFYFANSKNLFSQTNANGTSETITGNRAKYIVEEARRDVSHYAFNSVISHQLTEDIIITGGLNVSLYKSENYKLMDDLLGADFWVDVDQFAERDFADESTAQSDVNNPNRIIKEGDRFGYDYDIHVNTYGGFWQIEGTSKKLDWYGALHFSNTSMWRFGNMKNGLFPNDSEGASEKQNFLSGGIKAGAIYKITGRHLLRLNGAVMERAPFAVNTFVSPRTRNQILPGLKDEKIMSSDLSYLIRYPKLKVRATGYYTTIKDKSWTRSFYHDELNTFVNYMMTGVDQLFMGLEFGAEINITSTIVGELAFAKGQFLYNSRPQATIIQDNSTELLAQGKTIYFNNFRIGGIPQTAASVGIKYFSPKYWFTGINFNYFNDTYLDANPDRRTYEATSNFVSADPQVDDFIDQTKLDSDYVINWYIGKSWRIKNKYYLKLNLNVNNVLDNTEFETGGFEQLRYDPVDANKFPPRIGYMLGRTYFAMITFQF